MSADSIQQAWSLIEAGAYAQAAALLEPDPSQEARHVLGYAYTFAGRFDEARAVYRELWQAAQGQPDAHRFLHQLGMVEREAGDPAAALALFEQERALLEQEGAGALELAVNGYELAVCRHALGQERAAHAALAEAFAQAVTADDPATLGCLWRAAGDFARAEDRSEAAHDAYTNARTSFDAAKDSRAVQEIEERLSALAAADSASPELPEVQP
ncbi:tetratricopeptide repeat protein [Deinococcus sp. Marseille-Q6407]|uniref:tetratricopeptide repeat protein n=1 Tax=Deinococcus sp. Marseille-Q6407 TaxID=2969223 RepID=UPI0021C0BF1B|nr:tetratricopeptide repeat protein [Deinococcus sp. Marseille-Q6407]